MRNHRRPAAMVAAVFVLVGVTVAEVQGVSGADAGASARAGADFNADGYDDLAIGTPFEDVGRPEAGTVSIAYGGPDGAGSGGTQMVRPGLDGVVGVAHTGLIFGSAVATGDFDADGYDDLAVSARGYGSGVRAAGAVTVVYGSRDGLTGRRSRLFRQGRAPLPGQPEEWDEFGSALATGDLDADGYDDLAVGAPGESGNELYRVGEVDVLFGGATGLGGRATPVAPGRHGVPRPQDPGARFGSALAIGDLDGDGYDDLAVTQNGELSGTVTIVPGAADGLDERAARILDADDVPCGCPQPGLQFGTGLAAGDLDADGFDDLAIGAPGWDRGTVPDVGAVSVVFGTADRSDPAATFDQSSFGTVPEQNDSFGSVLTIGSVDGDGIADLVVGVPSESMRDIESAGIVVVVRGADGRFPGPATVYHQGLVAGRSETRDLFGLAVTAGDFSGDGDGDVVAGAPFEDIGSVAEAGNVTVIDETGGARAFDQSAVGGWVEESDGFGAAVG